jgi:hypothetical protein
VFNPVAGQCWKLYETKYFVPIKTIFISFNLFQLHFIYLSFYAKNKTPKSFGIAWKGEDSRAMCKSFQRRRNESYQTFKLSGFAWVCGRSLVQTPDQK